MRVLLFGSSHRRGQQGWTDLAPIRTLLLACRPDVVIHGASPAGGADALADEVARELGITVEPCLVDTSVDGPWPAAGHRRNARMHRERHPTHAAGFVSGAVGSAMSSGSKGMASICRRAGTPLVVYRDDGIEPPPKTRDWGPLLCDLYNAREEMRRLWVATPWARSAIAPAGKAVARAFDAHGNLATVEEQRAALAAAWAAVEALAAAEPRIAPWVAWTEQAVKRWAVG